MFVAAGQVEPLGPVRSRWRVPPRTEHVRVKAQWDPRWWVVKCEAQLRELRPVVMKQVLMASGWFQDDLSWTKTTLALLCSCFLVYFSFRNNTENAVFFLGLRFGFKLSSSAFSLGPHASACKAETHGPISAGPFQRWYWEPTPRQINNDERKLIPRQDGLWGRSSPYQVSPRLVLVFIYGLLPGAVFYLWNCRWECCVGSG